MPQKKKHHHHHAGRTRRGETPPGKREEDQDEHRMELIDKTVELRGSQILNMNTYHAIVCQRRFMACATVLAWFGLATLIAAVATPHWEHVDFWDHHHRRVFLELGVWGEWRNITNWKDLNGWKWISHFPKPDNVPKLAETDLKNYHTSQAFLAVVSIFLLFCTNLLALYTFHHHRYMYKRVVACMYVVVAMTTYGAIEVLANTLKEWGEELHQKEIDGVLSYEYKYETAYSTRLAQITIGVCIFAAISFAVGSHKQKGENAATAELEIEDREYHMGR